MEFSKSRQVQCFEAVMIERSLRKAAERLEMSVSEVSRQIRKLEGEMKLRLFDREPSGVVPTREAELYLEYRRGCESQFEVFRGQIDLLHSLKTGIVSISASESMMVPFVNEVLWGYCRDYPNVRVLLNQRATREIIEDVLTDAAHIGLVYNPPPTDGISVYRSVRDGLIAAVHPDHPLAKHVGPIPFARAVSYPFATMPSLYGLGGLMESVAHTEAVKFKPLVVANTLDVLRRFALEGLGVAFVSTFTIKPEVEAGTLVAMPIDHPALGKQSTSIVVKSRRVLSAAADELLRRIESNISVFCQ
ncbi:LysR family transcriptional regulator [Burkholderia humptydooensis]|uniref:LysR family transcriptional regulator n=1 Tax=Burkholderia humptydooensis TaxID=430531 RepID=A0A7T2U9B6_9BURK|nr:MULTISPECIES: LysR family transcriptional regulator [Burkholderia]AJY38436.1 bacterial regulatory helix-turn-helix, lysR family protein [Burkholderia sp. 2002721687]QPS47854.1 LysR family transcriptional regulator [Burkholderia humptydooensis]